MTYYFHDEQPLKHPPVNLDMLATKPFSPSSSKSPVNSHVIPPNFAHSTIEALFSLLSFPVGASTKIPLHLRANSLLPPLHLFSLPFLTPVSLLLFLILPLVPFDQIQLLLRLYLIIILVQHRYDLHLHALQLIYQFFNTFLL